MALNFWMHLKQNKAAWMNYMLRKCAELVNLVWDFLALTLSIAGARMFVEKLGRFNRRKAD